MDDILLNENFEIAFHDEDEVLTGDTRDQEVECMVWEQKGERREAPAAGFGIIRYLKRAAGSKIIENVQRFKRELQVELVADNKSGTVILNADLSEFKIELND